MEYYSLCCQACCADFPRVFSFKTHLFSPEHLQKMKDIFQEDTLVASGFIPIIVFVDPQRRCSINKPLVGLSLLTMCFSSTRKSFYLCHVCEQKFPVEHILNHIFSPEHYSNYLSYTNPNELSFSWNGDMRAVLRPKQRQQMDRRGVTRLQILEIPKKMMEDLPSKTYSEVMQTLSDNDRLIKLFEAIQPKRMSIHAYQNSSSRKHPLLGMQHLVECICVGPGEKGYYLCTLCNLTVATHSIIQHVLSFDHIYCYFKAWHPSTLLSKASYRDFKSLGSMMLDLAKQTEQIFGTTNASMKKVSLKPDEFKSLNFACYAEALKKLESITKSSLTTSIKPGNKLEYSAATTHLMPSTKQLGCKLCCQNCREVFDNVYGYEKHLTNWKHVKMLQKYFGEVGISYGYEERVNTYLDLFAYVKKSLRRNQPAVGTAMVVTCITTCTEAEPIYLCFACLDAFTPSCVKQHLESHKHLINSLLYLNPWRLPFAWKEDLDCDILRSLAFEEEKERNQDPIVLKIFDIPHSIFWKLDGSDYRQVLNVLEQYYILLKREVPQCETFSKLQENEKFPLLGKQFVVAHDLLVDYKQQQHIEVASLCLLCEKKLSNKEAEAHLFSWEHVTAFLNHFHPGSLNSNTVFAETLLDLAKQAACIHTSSSVQEVKLTKPIWEPYSYKRAINILNKARKMEGKGNLKPPITPMEKLVPRNKSASKKVVQNFMKDGEKNSSNAEKQEIERKEGQSDDKKTPTPKEKQLETKKEVSPKICPKEIKISDETNQEIKVKTEKPQTEKPSEKVKKTCQNTEENDGAQSGAERHSSVKHAQTQLSNVPKQGDNKRPRSLTEESHKDICPEEDVTRKKSAKRQRLCSKDKMSSEESTEVPNGGLPKKTEESETSRKEIVMKATGILTSETLQNFMKDGEKNSSNAEKQERERKKGQSDDKKTPTPKEKQLETKKEVSPKICPKEIKISDETNQKIKVKTEKPQTEKPSEKVKKTCQNSEKNDGAQSGAERHSSVKHAQTQLSNVPKQGDKKRPRSLTEESHKDICPEEDVTRKKSAKRQLCSKDKMSSEESTEVPYGGLPKKTDKSETSRKEIVMNAVQTLKAHNVWPNSVRKPPSTSSRSCVKSVNGSAALHTTHGDGVKVADMKTGNPKKCAAAADTHAITETTQVSLESNEDQRTTRVKVTKSTGNSPTCFIAPRRREDPSRISVSKCKTNKANLPPDGINNKCDSNVSKYKTTDSLKMESSHKREVAASISSGSTSECTTLKLAESTGTTASYAAVLKLLSVSKSAAVSRPQEISRSSHKVKPASCNGSPSCQAKPTVVREPTYRTAPSSKSIDALRCAGTASKGFVTTQTEIVSVAATKMPEVSAKPANDDAPKTLNEKNPGEAKTDLHKRDAHATSHLKSGRSEPIKPNQVTSHVSKCKATSSANPFKVGLSCVVVVSWKQKMQVYCLLCSVKLISSGHSHAMSLTHHYNYVKRKYPDWSAEPSDLARKLRETVTLLAKIENNMHNSQTVQRVEVEKEMYQKLRDLPEDEALEIVKKMMKKREASSTVHANAEASLRLEVSSPCEVSSSDDGMLVLCSGTGYSASNQSEQEDKNQHQTQLTQIAEIESSSIEEPNLTAGQFIERQRLDVEVSPASDLIQSPFQSCISISQVTPDSIPTSGIQAETMTDTVQQEEIIPYVDVTLSTESHGVTVEKTCFHSEHFVNPDSRWEKSDPASQGPQKYLESKEKLSPGQINSPNLLVATVSTGQQDQSGSSHKVEQAPKHCTIPGKLSLSEDLARTPLGKKAKGCSNLSLYLKASQHDAKPVIGMGSVWECRGNSLKTFFLCESCEKILSRRDICQHMVSFDHQLKYVWKEHTDLLQKFWFEEDLPHFHKMDIFFKIVVQELSKRENFFKADAQCILLESAWHEVIRTAPINEALKIVHSITDEEKPSFFHRPISATQQKCQQPEDQQKVERSPSVERLSAQAHQTNQKRDSAAQKRDGSSTVGGLEVKGISSRLDVNCSPVKFASPVPSVGTCLTPQETCDGLYLQTEFKPPVCRLPKSDPLLHVKAEEVSFRSTSFATDSSTVGQNPEVSLRN